jgi:hypothetical protein
VGAIVLVTAVLLFARSQFGSCAAAIDFLRGKALTLDPDSIDVGVGLPGEVRELQLCVRNVGFQEVKLLGYASDCACTAGDGFPVVLAPRQSAHLAIRVSFAEGKEAFARKVVYFTNLADQRYLVVEVSGRVAD